MNNNLESIIYEQTVFDKLKNQIIKKESLNAYLIESADEIYLETFLKMFASVFVSDRLNNMTEFLQDVSKIKNNFNIRLFGFANEKINIELINEILDFTALSGYVGNKKKIILIKDISAFDTRYQNKLLKTLEESKTNNVFIVGSKNPMMVIDTIKSRCKTVQLPKLSKKTLFTMFDGYLENQLEFAYQFSSGNITAMQSIIENEEYLQMYNIVKKTMLELRNSKQILAYYELVGEFIQRRGNLEKYRLNLSKLMDMYSIYIQHLLEIEENDNDEEAKKILMFYDKKTLAHITYSILETNMKNKLNINPSDLYKTFLFKMLEERYKCRK